MNTKREYHISFLSPFCIGFKLPFKKLEYWYEQRAKAPKGLIIVKKERTIKTLTSLLRKGLEKDVSIGFFVLKLAIG